MSKQTHLSRQMESRHVLMISLGGVIGTGFRLHDSSSGANRDPTRLYHRGRPRLSRHALSR